VLAPDGTLFQPNGTARWQSVFHFHLHVVPRWNGAALSNRAKRRPATPNGSTRSQRACVGTSDRRLTLPIESASRVRGQTLSAETGICRESLSGATSPAVAVVSCHAWFRWLLRREHRGNL
jgi:hypothetical protein